MKLIMILLTLWLASLVICAVRGFSLGDIWNLATTTTEGEEFKKNHSKVVSTLVFSLCVVLLMTFLPFMAILIILSEILK